MAPVKQLIQVYLPVLFIYFFLTLVVGTNTVYI